MVSTAQLKYTCAHLEEMPTVKDSDTPTALEPQLLHLRARVQYLEQAFAYGASSLADKYAKKLRTVHLAVTDLEPSQLRAARDERRSSVIDACVVQEQSFEAGGRVAL
jgi:hypothetical protein